MSQKTKHILVIRLSAMGDVAMTVPVLRALTTQYPELNITVLTKALFTPFFRNMNNLTVFPADLKGKHKGLFGLYLLAQQLNKANRFHAVADLHNVLRSQILKPFLKCRRFVTINKGRREKRALVKGEVFKPLATTHQRYADVFKALGCPVDLSHPNFPPKAELSDQILGVIGEGPQKRIGIAPFAAHKGKQYPLESMEVVIDALAKEYKILLFGGGKEEIAALNRMESRHQNVVSVAGKLTLEEEMDVISNLELMVSMDSGNGHIAAMLGIKTLTVWGVTHPYAGFAPFHQPEHHALLPDRDQYPRIPTSVYGNTYPEGYELAAGSIPPETIVKKIRSVI
ncbi:glycosyltransferase family 9 protein [Aestuariivivens sediminis]|uniref:glycosyltransferase family 9 protein n=1 Tax=Aestuariivivens sediminis TaxID=2913557 RepID=UPI001F587422|nr:glycosyltransferase family 9 protein [Aestuariivivens sediminis]